MGELERLRSVERELNTLIVKINTDETARLSPLEIQQLTRLLLELRFKLQEQIAEKERQEK